MKYLAGFRLLFFTANEKGITFYTGGRTTIAWRVEPALMIGINKQFSSYEQEE